MSHRADIDDRARDEVAEAASHDLRAPVVAIGQLVDSIQEDYAAELPHEVARRLVLLRQRADQLDTMLRALCRYRRASKATADRARSVDLEIMVRDLVRDLSPRPDAIVEVERGAAIAAPYRALRKVLRELLDNALRHARRIVIAAVRRPGGAELRVTDDGPGIAAARREQVWQAFAGSRRRPDGAAGLGLPIARRVAEAHGGRAWIDDAPGQGTRVCVFWPSPPAEAEANIVVDA